VRQGQSAGAVLELLELDKQRLDDKVWSESDDITAALRRVTDRMAYLNQRCLRDAYSDLAAYNADAGALAEPYHVVVVTGFPHGFTAEAVERMRMILEAGGPLGVSLYLVTDLAYRSGIATTNRRAGYHDPRFNAPDRAHDVWPGWDMFWRRTSCSVRTARAGWWSAPRNGRCSPG
jgi:hypothetical protein